MGYFDGLTAASFKKDAQGRDLFFIWGKFGKGRVVPTEADGASVRSYLKIYYICLIVGIVPMIMLAGERVRAALVPGDRRSSWCWRWRRWLPLFLRTRQWAVADERLTYREAMSASAAAHGAATLWFLIVARRALRGRRPLPAARHRRQADRPVVRPLLRRLPRRLRLDAGHAPARVISCRGGRKRPMPSPPISVCVLPSRISSVSTAPTAGPSRKPWPLKPKAWNRPGWVSLAPTHADAVRRIAVDAGPGADDRHVGEGGDEVDGDLGAAPHRLRQRPAAQDVRRRAALAGAEQDVAAQGLAQIEVAADEAEHRLDAIGQRLGHLHLRDLRRQRHRSRRTSPRPCRPRRRRNSPAPAPRSCGCRRARSWNAPLAYQPSVISVCSTRVAPALLRGEGEGRPDQARVGVAVVGAEHAADRLGRQPRDSAPSGPCGSSRTRPSPCAVASV